METILEYIMNNYTWFLGGSIVILLAVIGYYADKTNFGQKKDKEQNIKTEDELSKDEEVVINNSITEKKVTVEEAQEKQKGQVTINNIEILSDRAKESEPLKENSKIISKENNSNNFSELKMTKVSSQENDLNNKNELELSFEKFDKEFDELLPKKEIIDDELLDEIESLSLDKTQKIDLTNIPDLDDVELPKIKSFESDEEDIWNF